jgi:Sulfotransferase family
MPHSPTSFAAVPEPALAADRLVQLACDATGLEDFGGAAWREGLERLVDSLVTEARLHELGEQIAAGELVDYLSNRLGLVEWRRLHPEIANADVTPPVVIVGQARTGTTILHDLLAQDSANRVPLTWEVDRPLPPPETASFATDPRIAASQELLEGVELVIPGFQAMHPMGALLPQECVRMTGGDFRSMIFPTQYRVPSYARWLIDEADMASAYAYHRLFLQHLQSRHPAPRWVLKSPGHLWCLGALLDEYPNALMVQTHRDPLRIIASLSSLMSVLRRLGSDDISVPDIAAEFAEYLVEGLDRSVTAREDGTVPPDRVVDTQFRAFMADPFATIGAIYDRLGLDLSEESELRMRDFLAENTTEKHGGHHYSWADTELDLGEWRERTQRYQDYFGVPSEPLD